MSGTSFAAPFVTGTVALLWSLFPNASPMELVNAIRKNGLSQSHRSIIPMLLDAEAAYHIIQNSNNSLYHLEGKNPN